MSGATTRLARGGVRRTSRPAGTVTPMHPDQFDTLIDDIKAGRPTRAAGQPYPVLRFAAGTALWLLAANLGYLFVLFLRRG